MSKFMHDAGDIHLADGVATRVDEKVLAGWATVAGIEPRVETILAVHVATVADAYCAVVRGGRFRVDVDVEGILADVAVLVHVRVGRSDSF